MKTNPEVIDYVPAGGSSKGAGGRFAKMCAVLCALFVVMGYYRASVPDSTTMVDGATMSLLWFVGAFLFGSVAALAFMARWLRTGRIW